MCVSVSEWVCVHVCVLRFECWLAGWQQCILALGGRIEANKLLMLARSESEQIQQIQWKIPTTISQTDRHCIISLHVGQFEHPTAWDCNTRAKWQHSCIHAGKTGLNTKLLTGRERNPWTHINESWKETSYSRKVLGKFLSAWHCFCGCRLFLNFARAVRSFPKAVRSELSLTIRVPYKPC